MINLFFLFQVAGCGQSNIKKAICRMAQIKTKEWFKK